MAYRQKREATRESKIVWLTSKHLRARDLLASATMRIDRTSKKITYESLPATKVADLIAILDEEYKEENDG